MPPFELHPSVLAMLADVHAEAMRPLSNVQMAQMASKIIQQYFLHVVHAIHCLHHNIWDWDNGLMPAKKKTSSLIVAADDECMVLMPCAAHSLKTTAAD